VQTVSVTETAADAAGAFVEAFAEGWRAPTGRDAFAEHFEPWLDPQVRLIQPQTPVLVGHRAFREQFVRPLFALVPDIHGTVNGWAYSGDTLYIEVTLEAEGEAEGRRQVSEMCRRLLANHVIEDVRFQVEKIDAQPAGHAQADGAQAGG